jgi:hypothetical protein
MGDISSDVFGLPATRPKREAISLAAVIFGCTLIVVGDPASADDKGADKVIRELVPTPARCDATPGPLFLCRHENASKHTGILDLGFGVDGWSATLTHDYDDPHWHELLAAMRAFFFGVGVDLETLEACVAGALWKPTDVVRNGERLLCYRVELGHRVTHEVFVLAPESDRKSIARAERGIQ